MPIRVLWLIKGLGPGGAEHLLVNQASVLDRSVVDVEAAYVLAAKSELVPSLEQLGVPVHCLAGHRRLSWLGGLRDLLRTGRFAVVHVHSPALAAAARLIARTVRPRIKVVTTEHNAWHAYERPTRWANAATEWLDDARLAVSEEARSSMWKCYRSSTEELSHGVDVTTTRAAGAGRDRIRAELSISPDQLLVVTVANHRVHKDYPNLLRAAQQVEADEPGRFVFAAVGQGPLLEEIEALRSELGLGSAFRLLGYRSDARDVIAAADIFVLASRQEGRPVALMEALVLGIPVVVTEAGGMPEMVTDGSEGCVVPIENSKRLAEAIISLEAEEVRESCAAASARRGDDFDIAVAQRRLEQIYADVVAGLKPTAHQ